MTGAETATDGFFEHDDQVLWLQPRGKTRTLRRHRNGRVRSQAAKVTASLGFGALLAATSVGSAVAPSSPAHASVDASVTASRLQGRAPELRGAPSMALAREVNATITHRNDTDLLVRAGLGPTAHDLAAPGADEADEVRRFILAGLGPVAGADSGEPVRADRAGDPNEVLSFGGVKVRRHLVETILRAAEATGVDPVYMMALADKESSFQPNARARTSSVEGLFQFLNQTWLEMIRDHGAAHGLADEAGAVVAVDGELTIRDDETRERVFGLRRDPYVSALMAGELLKRDRKRIERRIGRNLTRNELYLAHFFGAGAAGKFITLRDGKPKQKAAGAFPQAARANRALFFTQEGKRKRGLTVAEVHERIDQMIERRASRYAAVSELVAFASAR